MQQFAAKDAFSGAILMLSWNLQTNLLLSALENKTAQIAAVDMEPKKLKWSLNTFVNKAQIFTEFDANMREC